jgi:hypothetical protein
MRNRALGVFVAAASLALGPAAHAYLGTAPAAAEETVHERAERALQSAQFLDSSQRLLHELHEIVSKKVWLSKIRLRNDSMGNGSMQIEGFGLSLTDVGQFYDELQSRGLCSDDISYQRCCYSYSSGRPIYCIDMRCSVRISQSHQAVGREAAWQQVLRSVLADAVEVSDLNLSQTVQEGKRVVKAELRGRCKGLGDCTEMSLRSLGVGWLRVEAHDEPLAQNQDPAVGGKVRLSWTMSHRDLLGLTAE